MLWLVIAIIVTTQNLHQALLTNQLFPGLIPIPLEDSRSLISRRGFLRTVAGSAGFGDTFLRCGSSASSDTPSREGNNTSFVFLPRRYRRTYLDLLECIVYLNKSL